MQASGGNASNADISGRANMPPQYALYAVQEANLFSLIKNATIKCQKMEMQNLRLYS